MKIKQLEEIRKYVVKNGVATEFQLEYADISSLKVTFSYGYMEVEESFSSFDKETGDRLYGSEIDVENLNKLVGKTWGEVMKILDASIGYVTWETCESVGVSLYNNKIEESLEYDPELDEIYSDDEQVDYFIESSKDILLHDQLNKELNNSVDKTKPNGFKI